MTVINIFVIIRHGLIWLISPKKTTGYRGAQSTIIRLSAQQILADAHVKLFVLLRKEKEVHAKKKKTFIN